MQWEHVRDALYPDTADVEDFSYRPGSSGCSALLRGEQASSFSRHPGHRDLLRAGRAALPRPRRPGLVRRGEPALGAWAGAAGPQPADQQRRQGRGGPEDPRRRRARLRRHPARPGPRLPRGAPAARAPGSPRAWSSSPPTARATTRSAATRSTPRPGCRAPAHPRGPAGCCSPPTSWVPPTARRPAARARGVPRGRRGRLRAAVHLRARRLRADPHRHGHPPRPGARLDPRGVRWLRCERSEPRSRGPSGRPRPRTGWSRPARRGAAARAARRARRQRPGPGWSR